MLKDFSEGTGSAAREAEMSANSWEGSLNKFQNSMSSFVNNFVTSGSAKSIINFFTTLINGAGKLVSAFGSLGTAVGVFAAIMMRNKSAIHFSFDATTKSIKFGTQAMNGLTKATLAQAAASAAMKVATVALNTVINVGLGAAIGGVISLIDNWIHREERLQQEHDEMILKIEESAKKYKESADNANEYLETYKEILAKDEITQEDREKLLEMQNAIIDTYGEQAEGIDLVNGKYREQLGLVAQLTQGDYKQQAIAATQLINEAVEATRDTSAQILSITDPTSKRVSDYIAKVDPNQGDFVKNNKEAYQTLKGYFELIKNIEGFTTTINTDAATENVTSALSLEDITNEQAISAITQALDRLYKLPVEERNNEVYKQLETYLQGLLAHYQNELQHLNQLLSDNIEAYIRSVNTDTGINWATVTDETFKEWYQAVINQYQTENPEVVQAIYDYFDRTYTSVAQRIARGTTTAEIAYESEQAFKKAMEQAETAVYEFNYSAYAEDVSAVTKEVETLQGVIDKIDSGKYTTIKDGFGLLESHPELLQYINDTDKLRQKLVEMQEDAPKTLIDDLKTLREQIVKIGNKEQLNQIDALIFALTRLGDTAQETAEALTADDYLKIQEKGIENIIDKLNEEKDALNDTLDNLNDRKQEIQDYYDAQINALKETNEERERDIELQEKQKALDDAKRNKVIVYSAIRGKTIQEDSSAVAKAQQDLNDAINEQQISQLEKRKDTEVNTVEAEIEAQKKLIESKEDEISIWKDYKDTIKDSTEEITNYNELYLEAQKQFVLDENSTLEQRVENLKTYLGKIRDIANGVASANGLSEADNVLGTTTSWVFGSTYDKDMELKRQDFKALMQTEYINQLLKSGEGTLDTTKNNGTSVFSPNTTVNITANKVDEDIVEGIIERYVLSQYNKKIVGQ